MHNDINQFYYDLLAMQDCNIGVWLGQFITKVNDHYKRC